MILTYNPYLITNIKAAPMPTIPICLGLGIVTFIVPFFLFTWSMKHLPAGIASALSVVEPMAATVFSAVLFREIPDALAIAGSSTYSRISPGLQSSTLQILSNVVNLIALHLFVFNICFVKVFLLFFGVFGYFYSRKLQVNLQFSKKLFNYDTQM